jgi:hypothetical protein
MSYCDYTDHSRGLQGRLFTYRGDFCTSEYVRIIGYQESTKAKM